MKFNISIEEFVNALTKLNLVIPAHSPLPILDNIMFDLKGNELKMVASDLEIFIKTIIKVEGNEDGEIAIPGKRLLDLVKSLVTKVNFSDVAVNFDRDLNVKPDFDDSRVNFLMNKLQYNSSKNILYFKEYFGLDQKNEFEALIDKEIIFVETTENDKIDSPAQYLKSTINELYKKHIEFLTESGIKLKIEADEKNKVTVYFMKGKHKNKYSLFGEGIEDFPMPEEKNELNKFEIGPSILRRFLTKVRHSVKYDEIRRNMAGVFFDIRKDELRFVATDGFRLSKIVSKKFSHKNPTDDHFIVPLKTCEMVIRLNNNEPAIVEYDNTLIKITFGNIVVFSKLIDDTFPNYETVIPKDNDKMLKVSKIEFQNALRRALIFADVITKRVKCEIKNDSLIIKADNPEIGAEGEETLDGSFICDEKDTNFDKEPFNVAFNIGYLLDCLAQIETPEVIFSFQTPSKASIAKPTEQMQNEDFMELIMPVRVS
jgi:DNA polymerase III subunit beta